MIYDVAIIGLGPAGSILAKYLDKKMKVIALDKKDTINSGFTKACGGMLAPDAQKAFSRFDMTLPKDILVDPQIFSVKTIDLVNDLSAHYQRHYVNMNRNKFDHWLISMIPSNVEVIRNSNCISVEKQNDVFHVVYSNQGEQQVIEARFVVGADGANSLVRRTFYPNFRIQTYLSIQQWFKDQNPSPSYSCVFDHRITSSYVWGLTKDEFFIFGGAFHPKTGKEDFELIKQKMKPYGFVLDHPLKTEACLVLRPSGPYNYCYGENGVFLIGEAAGFISPSSLEGISYAMNSAYILSECLNFPTRNPHRTYKAKTRSLRMKLFAKYIKFPFMYHPFLRKIVMNSGIASIKKIARK